MFVIASGNWSNGSDAGVWNRNWNNHRTNSNNNVGFRAAAYRPDLRGQQAILGP